MQLFILFETATGYSLFKREEFEEIGTSLHDVEKSVLEFARFSKIVKLFAFDAFTESGQGIANIELLNQGKLHGDLKNFLSRNLPKKTKKFELAISDIRLGQALTDELGINSRHDEITSEIIRGIRLHYQKFLKEITQEQLDAQQLGLGHTYSRSRVMHDVNRHDKSIIQVSALIDLVSSDQTQLAKDINTFTMRLKEWFSWHFPELSRIITENTLYVQVVDLIQEREGASQDRLDQLEQIIKDRTIATQVVEAAKNSMGQDLAPHDHVTIRMFTARINGLIKYRDELQDFLKERVDAVAPNLGSLLGQTVSARLISHAGGLRNLAKLPASTIQILGAEKALFRALKEGTNTPKYGLLYNCSFIGRAQKKNKGRISRYLSNKCAIAARMDHFSLVPTAAFGEKMKDQVEERLKFFETGDRPGRNVDVMKELLTELREKGEYRDREEGEEDEKKEEEMPEEPPKKKKKKKAKKEEEEEVVEEKPKKLKKKKKSKTAEAVMG